MGPSKVPGFRVDSIHHNPLVGQGGSSRDGDSHTWRIWPGGAHQFGNYFYFNSSLGYAGGQQPQRIQKVLPTHHLPSCLRPEECFWYQAQPTLPTWRDDLGLHPSCQVHSPISSMGLTLPSRWATSNSSGSGTARNMVPPGADWLSTRPAPRHRPYSTVVSVAWMQRGASRAVPFPSASDSSTSGSPRELDNAGIRYPPPARCPG